jgi:hypothetical protein
MDILAASMGRLPVGGGPFDPAGCSVPAAG